VDSLHPGGSGETIDPIAIGERSHLPILKGDYAKRSRLFEKIFTFPGQGGHGGQGGWTGFSIYE
jgi:hypothetical protein